MGNLIVRGEYRPNAGSGQMSKLKNGTAFQILGACLLSNNGKEYDGFITTKGNIYLSTLTSRKKVCLSGNEPLKGTNLLEEKNKVFYLSSKGEKIEISEGQEFTPQEEILNILQEFENKIKQEVIKINETEYNFAELIDLTRQLAQRIREEEEAKNLILENSIYVNAILRARNKVAKTFFKGKTFIIEECFKAKRYYKNYLSDGTTEEIPSETPSTFLVKVNIKKIS